MTTNQDHTALSATCRRVRLQMGGPATSSSPDIATHLVNCATCRAEARRLNAAWTLLNVIGPSDASPRFTAGVWAKIAAREQAGLRRPTWSLRWAAAGLAVVLATAVPVMVWYQNTHDRPELVAQLDLMESRDMLADLEVVEDLDVLLLLDDP